MSGLPGYTGSGEKSCMLILCEFSSPVFACGIIQLNSLCVGSEALGYVVMYFRPFLDEISDIAQPGPTVL